MQASSWIFPVAVVVVGCGFALLYWNRKAKTLSVTSHPNYFPNLEISGIDLSQRAFEAEVFSKITKPLINTPVHADIPRLVKKITVSINGSLLIINLTLSKGTIAFADHSESLNNNEADSKETPALLINQFLVSLAQELDPNLVTPIEENFVRYIGKKNVDEGRLLLDFLVEIVGEETRTVKLLKSCTQSAISGAVMRLKYMIGTNEFPYKDVRSGWTIIISITNNEITTTHRKWEQSFNDGEFKFQWQFDITYDKQVNQLKRLNLKVIDVQFAVNAKQRKQQFLALLQKYNLQ